jgi:hypothetical protein
VLRDTGWLPFADLHSGRSEVDEPLDKPSLGSRPAKGVPKLLPRLVRFPGESLVEEIEGMEPPRVSGEERRQSKAPGGWVVGKVVEREWGWLGRIEEVPAGVVHGMRQAVPRDVGGGRERDVRGVARRWSRSGHRNTSLGSDGS